MIRKRRGITLVELIIVVAVMAAVMAALAPYIRTIHQTWQYGDRRTEMLQHGRVSMDRMVKTLRSALCITDIDTSGQGSYIRLCDESCDSVVFFHNVPGSPYYIGEIGNMEDKDLVMQRISPAGSRVSNLFAKSVENITFTYLKETMDPIDLATAPEDVRAVKIDMALSDPAGELSGTLPVSSLAYCRAIGAVGEGVWVSNYQPGEVVKLDPHGNELIRKSGFMYVLSVSANPADGSCWFTAWEPHSVFFVIKLNFKGCELLRKTDILHPMYVSVNPTDGSCWVGGYGGWLTKLDSNGNELLREHGFGGPIAVDPTDGSLWVATSTEVIKLDSNGNELLRKNGFNHPSPWGISVNPDDSCWVTDTIYNQRVVKLDSDGNELVEKSGFSHYVAASVNPTDGSCWLGTTNDVIKLDSNGNELLRKSGFAYRSGAIAVNPTDGSLWVTDPINNRVIKLDSDGNELAEKGGFMSPRAISIDGVDGERE